jgi:hypothetical protein
MDAGRRSFYMLAVRAGKRHEGLVKVNASFRNYNFADICVPFVVNSGAVTLKAGRSYFYGSLGKLCQNFNRPRTFTSKFLKEHWNSNGKPYEEDEELLDRGIPQRYLDAPSEYSQALLSGHFLVECSNPEFEFVSSKRAAFEVLIDKAVRKRLPKWFEISKKVLRDKVNFRDQYQFSRDIYDLPQRLADLAMYNGAMSMHLVTEENDAMENCDPVLLPDDPKPKGKKTKNVLPKLCFSKKAL